MGRLAGRVAIVTGGSKGISAVIVARLVSEGAKVMVADLAAEASDGEQVSSIRTDVTSSDDVAAAVAANR